MLYIVVVNDPNVGDCDKRVSPVAPTGGRRRFIQAETAKAISSPDISDKAPTKSDQDSEN